MDDVDRSVEPMEVDLSSNSFKGINNSFKIPQEESISNCFKDSLNIDAHGETTEDQVQQATTIKVKKLFVNLNQKKIKRGTTKTRVISALLVACLSILVYYYASVVCIKLDISAINEILSNKLYGQTVPRQNIIKALQSPSSQKIIFLYGGTGVGKTYSIDLMMNNVWNYSNVYHYTMPSFKTVYQEQILTGLIFCSSCIIVIDDLSYENINIQFEVNELIDKSVKLGKNLTLFLIFNCHVSKQGNIGNKCENFQQNLEEVFADINIIKYYIKYNELTKDTLTKCIRDELKLWTKTNNIDVNNRTISNLINNYFNVELDGCKNVHKKVQSLNLA